jgi:hypothetical protein
MAPTGWTHRSRVAGSRRATPSASPPTSPARRRTWRPASTSTSPVTA